ncbi:hypothetical protein BBJ28_00019469, partial [Nothophytophthora sp. Chile5]
RSGVVVRNDVRKDAEGFEDIDDFWADADESMDKDDSLDDEDSLSVSEKDASAGDTSADISVSSEREVRLSGISSLQSSDRESMDIVQSAIPSRRTADKNAAASPPPSPARSDVSFDFGGGSPQDSGEKNVTMREKRSKKQPEDSQEEAEKANTRRKESFEDVRGFDEDVASPFSMNDGSVTPLSNGTSSDRTLKPIPSFSDKNSSDSPAINKELFRHRSTGSDSSDNEPKKKPAKRSKKPTKRASVGAPKTPTKRLTGKYGYRNTPPGTDTSTLSVQTDDDNDESFQVASDDGGETGDDSFYLEPPTPTGNARDTLPNADEILDEMSDNDSSDGDGRGLRRSKRKRFKPLAWFKGEHLVYERTFVGVGTVMPTVVGVERVGAELPKTERKVKPPSRRVNNSKPLPFDDLPEDVKAQVEDSEWATLFDSQAGCMNDLNVICRSSEIRLRKLPTEERGGAVVHAFAGQSFNLFSPAPFARWISGRVVLPPGAWKEPEGVGAAVQLFYVTGCQPKALELALAPETDDDFFTSKHTTHFVLSPGDEFYVPAGNVYYVKNHSSSADCDLRFTILKPEAPQAPADENGSDAEEKEPKKESTSSASKRKREASPDTASPST